MKIKTRQLAFDAMMAAMCAVLGYIAIDTGSIKVTFESLPVLLGAMLFGPVDGLLIGVVGTGLYQLLRYGVSITTLLWMLPYALCGLLAGWYAKRKQFRLSPRQILFAVVCNELIITALNTGTLYLDSKIFAYYFPGFISASLVVRFVVCIIKAIAFSLVLPLLIRGIKKAIRHASA